MTRTIAITGAYGYLGSLLRRRLQDAGWETRALVRTPRAGDRAVAWRLDDPSADDALSGADALLHCAYDLALTRREDVWRTNVEGTRRLLESAGHAGVTRVLVLSSMSAYHGTTQIYGQAKLAIEELTLAAGGIAIRPGLVYGGSAGGMAASLLKLTKLPLVPLIGGGARQFPVHEDDFATSIVTVLEAPTWTPEVFGVAQPQAVSFQVLLASLAAKNGRELRFVRVPWQLVYGTLRALEAARVPLPLRSDSLLGLIRPAPSVPVSRGFPELLHGLRQLGGAEVSSR